MGKGKAKKGGKKKKSKEAAEQERLVREEEERVIAEELAAAIEKERLEKQKRDEENKLQAKIQRDEELVRLTQEEQDSLAWQLRVEQESKDALVVQKERRDWQTVTNCCGLPDVGSKAEMNTYLNEWEAAETSGTANGTGGAIVSGGGGGNGGVAEADLTRAMDECQDAMEIVREVQAHLASLWFGENGSEQERGVYENFIARFRKVALAKIDAATAFILQHPEDLSTNKNEVLIVRKTKDIKFGLWFSLTSKGFRMKTIDFKEELGVILEIPKALALQHVAVRYLHWSRESDVGSQSTLSQPINNSSSIDTATSSVDYRTVLGGVFAAEVLQIPPPAKLSKGWLMRPVTTIPGQVERNVYPFGAPSDGAGGGTGMGVGSPAVGGGMNSNAVTLKFALPTSAHVVPETVELGWFDVARGVWSQEGVMDFSMDLEKDLVSIQTTVLTEMAMLQPVTLDMPLTEWHMQPVRDGATKLTFVGPRWQVEILADDNGCTLLCPKSPPFQRLCGMRMEPQSLLDQLASCGVDLRNSSIVKTAQSSIEMEEENKINKNVKVASLEKQVHKAMGRIGCAFRIRPGKGNTSFGNSRMVLLIRECMDGDERNENNSNEAEGTAGRLVLVESDDMLRGGVKYSFLEEEDVPVLLERKLSNVSNLPSEEEKKEMREKVLVQMLALRPAIAFTQLDLLLAHLDFASPEALQRVEDAARLQQLAVAKLLDLVRPFSNIKYQGRNSISASNEEVALNESSDVLVEGTDAADGVDAATQDTDKAKVVAGGGTEVGTTVVRADVVTVVASPTVAAVDVVKEGAGGGSGGDTEAVTDAVSTEGIVAIQAKEENTTNLEKGKDREASIAVESTLNTETEDGNDIVAA